jgi:high-affinity iron transporter
MLYSFLITLREGLEAALIVGILVAYLVKAGAEGQLRPVMAGALAGVAVSAVGGLLLHLVEGSFAGPALELFEGVMMVFAVALLTYMIFYMARQARGLKAELHRRADRALQRGAAWPLAILAFTVVIREGLETVVFLAAGSAVATSIAAYVAAAVLGAALAAALGYLLYRGSLRLDLRRFFAITGLVLIVFAAGLLANAVKELQEAGTLSTLVAHVWDTDHLLPDTTTIGRMLAALLGYDASPSLEQVTAFLGYLGLVGIPFWLGSRPRAASPGAA